MKILKKNFKTIRVCESKFQQNWSRNYLLGTNCCVQNRQVWFIQIKLTKISYIWDFNKGCLYRIPFHTGFGLGLSFIVFNTTFNNISIISEWDNNSQL